MGRPPFAISCESTVIPKSRQTRKETRCPGDPGKGSAAQHKGSLVMYTTHGCAQRAQREGKGAEGKDPAHCLPPRAQQLRFFFVCCCCCPALPVMRIIPASAGWQAQHGLCSGSGSGSGISTRAKGALSRPRRRGRPFRQHLVRPGCRRGTVVSCRRGRGAATPVDSRGGGCFN